ncbi:MAG: hypothetical protein Q9199_005312 [Rusavskia elegans]
MIISALRAYYADINFENLTDSRSLLDVLTPLELAPSIIVASSPVLGPILKKWFGDENRGPGTATPPKSSNHKFQRIDDNGLSAATPSFQNIELGHLFENWDMIGLFLCRKLQSHDQTTRRRLYYSRYQASNSALSFEAKEMKKARCVDNVHIPLQFRPQFLIDVEDIRAYERRFQPSAVLEQILGDAEEAGLEINRRTVASGSPIVRELADILGEAAPQVHQFGILSEAREDIWIDRMLGERADEEAKETYAWIGTYGVGSALLPGEHRRMAR